MKKLNLIGMRFNRLLCLTEVPNTSPRKWLFLCDCGKTKEIIGSAAKCGTTKSCGCLHNETSAKSRYRDLCGQRFGRLTVTSKAGNKGIKNEVVWNCLCVCGKSTTSTTGQLNYGRKQSCGCIRSEQMRELGFANKKENPISRTAEYQAAKKRRFRQRPAYLIAERVSRLMAWALASVGAIKRSSTFDLLGFTPAQLKTHIEKQFLPGMSWANRSEWHVDHIIPISTATCEADVIALNQLSNLRPLWAIDNNRKGCRRDRLI